MVMLTYRSPSLLILVVVVARISETCHLEGRHGPIRPGMLMGRSSRCPNRFEFQITNQTTTTDVGVKTISLIQGQCGQPESKEQVGLFELRTRMSHFFTFRPLFKRRKPIHAAEVPFPTQILSALKSFSMVETDPLPPPWPEEHRHWTGNSPVCSLMDACISSEDSRSNEFSLCFARSPARRGKSLHTINQPNSSCLCH